MGDALRSPEKIMSPWYLRLKAIRFKGTMSKACLEDLKTLISNVLINPGSFDIIFENLKKLDLLRLGSSVH